MSCYSQLKTPKWWIAEKTRANDGLGDAHSHGNVCDIGWRRGMTLPLGFSTIAQMTISESLQAQWQRGRVIMNTVGVIPPLILFVTVFTGVAEHAKNAVTAWCLGTAVAAIAIWVVVGLRLRCPICRATVGRSMKKGTPLRTCPACGADFSQPMPGRRSK